MIRYSACVHMMSHAYAINVNVCAVARFSDALDSLDSLMLLSVCAVARFSDALDSTCM